MLLPRGTSLGLGRRSREIGHASDDAGGTRGPDPGGGSCGGCPGAAGTPDGAEACSSQGLVGQARPLIQKLHVEEAWQITRGDPAVVVGVIDNGFDYFHPDLKGQLRPGYYYPGGYHGESLGEIAHGTLVSSLIVARADRPGAMTGLGRIAAS